jgi:cbb3-type cytochrome oxidase maturation protein
MESLYLLVPLSVALILAIGALFWWALHGGQFDDLEGPAHRILLEDEGGKAPPVDVDQARPGGRG